MPARAALFGMAPVEWQQLKATAKTFPWGKVPRLAGAEEGGGTQHETGKRGAKWYIVRIRRRMCIKQLSAAALFSLAALGSFPRGKLLSVTSHFTIQRTRFVILPGSGG